MAAGNTYTPIATTTLGSAVASYTFSSIPSTYTDLVLVSNLISPSSGSLYVRVNSDTATNYSRINLYGNGTTATSDGAINETLSYVYPGAIGSSPSTLITNFHNYSNTTANKSWFTRANDTTLDVSAVVALWRSTAAINTILFAISIGTFGVGTTFTLYGITCA